MGFSRGSAVKNPPANMGDVGSTPGPERFPLEEEMTPHCCCLAWKIPWTEEPGGLQSVGGQRVGRDCVCTCLHTRERNETTLEDPQQGGQCPSLILPLQNLQCFGCIVV